MNEQQIQKILDDYKRKRQRERDHYHNVKKHDPVFVEKNRLLAKQYYEKNNQRYRNNYLQDRDFKLAKSSYSYHKKNNTVDKYKNKYPERFDLLVEKGFIVDSINDDETEISNHC
jgi:mannitol-1-phosphate/altronate dehydrogenase